MLRLSDEQWERIRKHFPEEHFAADRPGRKPIAARRVLEVVLWILNTGAQWHMLPQSYPNYKTVHRRFQQWCRDEVIRAALTDLANSLREQGALDESECFIDATFASAKGGGAEVALLKQLAEESSFVAFEGYDTVAVLAETLRSHGTDRARIAESWLRVAIEGTRGQIQFSRTPGISIWQWAWAPVQVVDRNPAKPDCFRILHAS